MTRCWTADEIGKCVCRNHPEAEYVNGGRHPKIVYRGRSIALGHGHGELPKGTHHAIVKALMAAGLGVLLVLPWLA